MRTLLRAVTVVFSVFISCNSNQEEKDSHFGKDTPRYDIPLSLQSAKINAQVQQFSFDFYREIARSEKKDNNFCTSPFSLSCCLGMVMNGTDGKTYTEMQQTLGFVGFDYQQINEYMQMMQTELPKLDGRVIFTNANSLWIKDHFPIFPSFVKQTKTYYDAEVYNEPFDGGTLRKINDWCNTKTNGLIPEIINNIMPETVSFLINALYFKGMWKNEFNKSDTRDEPFYCSNGRTVDVPTMKQEQTLRSYTDEQVVVVELPYGNEAFSMVVFKATDPQKQTIDAIIQQLDEKTWTKWNKQMTPRGIILYLPRFLIKSEFDLIPNMQQLGIHDAFYTNANFKKMSDTNLYISLLKQKTFLELNEAGTEAAAVTVAGINYTSSSEKPSIPEVRFNHPFGYILQEKSTGAILFAGRINLPE